MSCPALETTVAWVLGDLTPADAERFEEHFFGCDACARNALRVERVVEQLALALPTVLTAKRRRALSARDAALPAVAVAPGQRGHLKLGGSAPIGLWLLQAPLEEATRVDIEAWRDDGAPVFALADVPYDAEDGEVALACQEHFRAVLGSQDLHVRLRVMSAAGERPVGVYVLEHEFENP